MVTLQITNNSPEAMRFLEYARSLPFVNEEDKWQQALDEGAVTVNEFVQEAKRQIKEHHYNA